VRTALALGLAGSLLGCGGGDPGRDVIAELGDLRVERAELDGALAAVTLEATERDRVASRLLDSLLEEKLLAEEARRRGVTVSEADTREYLADLPPGSPVTDLEGARRHILVRKLQDALLRALGPPSQAEVDLLAGRLRVEAESAGASVVLRTLRVASEQEGQEVGRRLQAGETTFDQQATTCCYASSDKSWVTDTAGVRWETFFTHGEATSYGEDERLPAPPASACCGPKTQTASC